MLAAVLALASSLSWGLSDFLGGLQSRRHSLLAVLVLSQGFALVVLAATIAAGASIRHDAAATAWAVGSGMLGLLGLTAFYRALAIGTMSIVAPLSATGAVIPVLVGLASGERPRTLQLVGMALALVGGVLAGREAAEPDAQARRAGRTAVLLALLAAVGFGSFFAGMDRAQESGDGAWVLLAARTPEVLLLLAACAVRRPVSGRDGAARARGAARAAHARPGRRRAGDPRRRRCAGGRRLIGSRVAPASVQEQRSPPARPLLVHCGSRRERGSDACSRAE